MEDLWNYIKRHKAFTVAISISIIGLILLFAFGVPLISDTETTQYLNDGLLRLLIGVLFLLLMYSQGYRHLYRWTKPQKEVYILLFFAALVAINNFPISAFVSGRAVLTASPPAIIAFVFENIAIGFFEEIVFRTMFLVLIFQYVPESKYRLLIAIVLSSLFFGLVHIINIFYGASIPATLLQVLYSILTGMMFSVLFVTTKNIWISMIAHILYNIAGSLFVRTGTVLLQFDTITILSTIVIGAITAVIYYTILTKKEWEEDTFFLPVEASK